MKNYKNKICSSKKHYNILLVNNIKLHNVIFKNHNIKKVNIMAYVCNGTREISNGDIIYMECHKKPILMNQK